MMEGSHFKPILHQEAFFAENKAICKQTRCLGGHYTACVADSHGMSEYANIQGHVISPERSFLCIPTPNLIEKPAPVVWIRDCE